MFEKPTFGNDQFSLYFWVVLLKSPNVFRTRSNVNSRNGIQKLKWINMRILDCNQNWLRIRCNILWKYYRWFPFYFLIWVSFNLLCKVLIIELFQAGYKGFYSKNTVELTPNSVNDIHKRGGTVIGTSRGGHDTVKIVDNIEDRGINQVEFQKHTYIKYEISTAKPSDEYDLRKNMEIFPNYY